jgi:hypothetical protein
LITAFAALLSLAFSANVAFATFPRPGQHGRDIDMVLPVAVGLNMDNHLLFAINETLAVIPLDDTVGSHHAGRVIVRTVALFFSPRGTLLGLVLGQPCIDQILGSYAARPVPSLRYLSAKIAISIRLATRVWMANSKVPGIYRSFRETGKRTLCR